MIEEWIPIKGYEGIYEVSNLGRIKNVNRNNILTATDNGNGYKLIGLSKGNRCKNHYIHRLVLQAFEPINSYLEVNHIDNDTSNNKLENLEWVTRRRNVLHAYDTGTRKLKFEDESEEIIGKYKNGVSLSKLSYEYKTTKDTIKRLLYRNNIKVRTFKEQHARKVICYFDNKEIERFDCINKGAKWIREKLNLGYYPNKEIINCCKGKKESIHGYKWEYVKEG